MERNWRDEFKCRSYGLSHQHPEDFYICRWQKGNSINAWFLAYRFILAFWSFGVLVSSFVEGSYKVTEFLIESNQNFVKFWPIYLTNWGFFCLTLQLISSLIVIVEQLLKNLADFPKQVTLLQRISWLLYNVTTAIGLFISVIFWAQIYKPKSHLSAQSVLTHGINSFVILVDLFVSARPWRLVHFYQPFMMLTCYVLFSYFYWLADGTNEHGYHYIYTAFDWSNIKFTWPRMALALISIIPIHAAIWVLHLFRDFVYRRWFAKDHFVQTQLPTSFTVKH